MYTRASKERGAGEGGGGGAGQRIYTLLFYGTHHII